MSMWMLCESKYEATPDPNEISHLINGSNNTLLRTRGNRCRWLNDELRQSTIIQETIVQKTIAQGRHHAAH